MGYNTDFYGSFKLNKKLDEETHDYLAKFSHTRRMARKLGAEFGIDGEFYVDGSGLFGQDHEDNIKSYNHPPSTQPGLWCQWVPSSDGTSIEWNGAEKFYDYVEWLRYIVKSFLAPKGYILNGEVEWNGEDRNDRGLLVVIDNVVQAREGRMVYGE